MAPAPPRLQILSIGGNSISAFLSWRLQTTNACDVTLVWKAGFDSVAQYGISFKSKLFGNERFKPYNVVRAPEDASNRKLPFDYVLLCVKALPDVYDLATVIESVVTPQHTCILLNTTQTLGVESYLEDRFPTNVVLSLVSNADLNQLGVSEFEHNGSTDIWVGPANKNPSIPVQIQRDMAEALAMTLSTGQVDCKVSDNIRQLQYSRMIGPIAFHPLSVLFETPSHSELMQKTEVKPLINGIIDELIALAEKQDCVFSKTFKDETIQTMLKQDEPQSTMYQDFLARRPMEIETYLGSPIKLAKEAGVPVPRIETLYPILHNFNIQNQSRPVSGGSPTMTNGPLPPRMSSTGPRPPPNGMMNGGFRPRNSSMGPPPPPGRRGPPSMNGHPRPMPNGMPPRGPNGLVRRPSLEMQEFQEEFGHLAGYDDIPEGSVANGYMEMGNGSTGDLALRERELALRQKEIHLREQELNMRRTSRRPPPPPSHAGFDDDDDDDFFDPMSPRGPPLVDPDSIDMMSVTSRRNRKGPPPSAGQFRRNPEGAMGGPPPAGGGRLSSLGGFRRSRLSTRMMPDIPGANGNILDNPMVGYSSNRYGTVDRKTISDESRAGSLTLERLQELQGAGGMPGMSGAYPAPPRRTSLSPGESMQPNRRVSGRPSPPSEAYLSPGGPNMNGRPSPPGAMRQPVPRHPPGQGNAVAPQQVEQHAGVSKPYPPNRIQNNVRSLTGSASASTGSGESAQLDSENSAHSSQSSFGPRHPLRSQVTT